MKKMLIVLLIIVAVFFIFSKSNKQPDTLPGVPSEETAVITPPQGWKKYDNVQLGFSFYTPPEFIIETNGQHSVIAKHPKSQSKVGDVEFFYVSVIPESLFDNETGEAYNYSKSFHKKLLDIPVGDIKNLSVNDGQKDWFMYERSGDLPINRRVAKVFLNQRPWEFPAGIWGYRYVFENPKKIVLVGGYFVGGSSDTPLSFPVFQKIMSTLLISE